jgi:hypothetical protein
MVYDRLYTRRFHIISNHKTFPLLYKYQNGKKLNFIDNKAGQEQHNVYINTSYNVHFSNLGSICHIVI